MKLPKLFKLPFNILGLLPFVLLLAVTEKSLGQDRPFYHLTVEDGLSKNSVLAIAQDKMGFIWLGTAHGLNRYDGNGFKVFKNETPSTYDVTNSYIHSLFCDKNGTLWVGTGLGLEKYHPDKNEFEKIRLNRNDTSWSPSITCIYEDNRQQLWVCTNNGLYLLTNREKNIFEQVGKVNLPDRSILCIFEDKQGNYWVGTNNGLAKMVQSSGQYKFEIFKHDAAKSESISNNYVTAVVEDHHQNIWIGTYGGLNKYNAASNAFTCLSHSKNNGDNSIVNNNIRTIVVDKAGKLWIGTQEGLSVFEPPSQQFTSYKHDPTNKKSLSQNSIYSICEDVGGSFWIGTYFGGVNVTSSAPAPFTVYQNGQSGNSISNDVISTMVEDDKHQLFVGTEGGGLNYFDKTNNRFTAYKNIPTDTNSLGSNLIKVLFKDKDNQIWVGTRSGGLNLFDGQNNRFKRYFFNGNDAQTLNTEITAITESENNQFWVGTSYGLNVYDRIKTGLTPSKTIKPAILANSFIKALFTDTKGNVWIGTNPRLCIYANNKINELHPGYSINCIAEDKQGNIWVGLHYGGLAIYNQSAQSFTFYTQKDGLPSNDVVSILPDSNSLWLGTGNGLSHFDLNSRKFQTYTVGDGLAGNEFNPNACFKDDGGRFFFGGYNGLTSFYPRKIEPNNSFAPLVFTGLRLFNKPVSINDPENELLDKDMSLTQTIRFRHDQNVFTIEFALMDFKESGKKKYGYEMEGFDKNWNEAEIPSVTYTSLPPGNYTFLARAANNNGEWGKPIALQIKILPPFWRTWWAYCVYILLLVAIVFFMARFFFLRTLIKKEDELHQVKLNFFTNVSHEIRTHLTLIMAPVDKLLEFQKNDGFTNQQLGNVKDNANRLLRLVSELMDFRKAETNHLTLNIAQYDLVKFPTGHLYFVPKPFACKEYQNVVYAQRSDYLGLF